MANERELCKSDCKSLACPQGNQQFKWEEKYQNEIQKNKYETLKKIFCLQLYLK